MIFQEQYPNAYEDDFGTIWTSPEAAGKADWEFVRGGDAFMGEILGWSWVEAEENFLECQRLAKRKAFWRAHPRFRDFWWFVLRHYRFVSMFSSTVWRDWEGRISWSTAWTLASDLWLK